MASDLVSERTEGGLSLGAGISPGLESYKVMGEFPEQAQKLCLFSGILEPPHHENSPPLDWAPVFSTCSTEKSRVAQLLRSRSQNGPYKTLFATLSCDFSNFQKTVFGLKGCVLELLTALPAPSEMAYQQ